VLNRPKTLNIELGDATGEIALLTIDESDLTGATVNLYDDDMFLGSFTYGESHGGYSLGYSNGTLVLRS